MLISLLGTIVGVIAGLVLLVQVRTGRFFTLLTFATGLFALEGVGAAIKARHPELFPDFAATTPNNPLPFVPLALAIYIAGYLLFLSAYVYATFRSRRRVVDRAAVTERFFQRYDSRVFWNFLLLITFATIAIGFVQQYERIRAAGSIIEFVKNAYLYRFGTAVVSNEENALVGVTNLISGCAVGLLAFWTIAWANRRLGPGRKTLVILMMAFLLFRQWSSMFRGTFFFTIIAIIAAVASERNLSVKRIAWIGSAAVVLLLATNFVHYYLYSVTAGWTRQSFLQAQAYLLAPHSHIYTLATILQVNANGPPHLHGTGIVESIFFFVPRILWLAKLPSDQYGTMAVQAWAGLPTYYQLAITAVGELIAHFGTPAIVLMMLYGLLYGVLDQFRNGSPDLRAALFGMLLPRVLADQGMGISAVAITLVSLGIFLAQMFSAEFLARLARSSPRRRIRRIALSAARPFGQPE